MRSQRKVAAVGPLAAHAAGLQAPSTAAVVDYRIFIFLQAVLQADVKLDTLPGQTPDRRQPNMRRASTKYAWPTCGFGLGSVN